MYQKRWLLILVIITLYIVQGMAFASAVKKTIASPLSSPAADTPALIKIPVDGTRWYQLNSASDGIASMFDGDSSTAVQPTYGKIFKNFDAYYPVLPGEQISLYKIRMYSNAPDFSDSPLTVSVITAEGKRVNIGTFYAGPRNVWLGPHPDRAVTGNAQYLLDAPMLNIRYIVLNVWGNYPTEMEFYGTYKAGTPVTPVPKKANKLSQYFGVNAFEWNFESSSAPGVIDEARMKPAKAFTQVRHYLDWTHIEGTPGNYTFNPSPDGGWNYDAMYKRLKAEGIEVLADIKTVPGWMQDTYPADMRDNENVPVRYGKDFSDPNSYLEQAKAAYQFAARYGSNASIDTTSIHIAPIAQYPNGPVNAYQKSLGLIKYIECDNERDKWWKGRKAYQTAWEYAANLSAFYDGNQNTMGPGVGVKNADPNMQVVMGGLAYANTDYIKGMVDWCRQHRGYRADGTVNLCWDIINYHYYANNSDGTQGGVSTRGSAPEVSPTGSIARQFISAAHQYAADMPVWVTESGYDLNQGSALKTIAIGSKTPQLTQADWELRTALLYARAGVQRVFMYEMYDDNASNTGQYSSSGLVNDDKSRRPVADYFSQFNNLIGKYTYMETLAADPLIDRYELNGHSAYILTIPDEKGRSASYSLKLTGADSAAVYTPAAGSEIMSARQLKLKDSQLTLTVTETPQVVIPFGTIKTTGVTDTAAAPVTVTIPKTGIIPPNAGMSVYPNPATGSVTLSFSSKSADKVIIRVADAASGRLREKMVIAAVAGQVVQSIDLSNFPGGVYLLSITQGNFNKVKKVVKIN